MDLICSCQNPSVSYTEYGGSFTKTEVCQINSLICINCKKCIAIKNNFGDYKSLDNLLCDSNTLKNGWMLAENNQDLFKHKLLNFVQYRINEPPKKESFECNYSEPKIQDQVYLLWTKSYASGFITIRDHSEAFQNLNLSIIDTVYIRKSARGNGYLTLFLKSCLTAKELGFSEPISNSMLIVLIRLLKKYSEYREKIWLVNEENGERQILWWSAIKLSRQRNLNLKSILN